MYSGHVFQNIAELELQHAGTSLGTCLRVIEMSGFERAKLVQLGQFGFFRRVDGVDDE
jgi:hypothetical protein